MSDAPAQNPVGIPSDRAEMLVHFRWWPMAKYQVGIHVKGNDTVIRMEFDSKEIADQYANRCAEAQKYKKDLQLGPVTIKGGFIVKVERRELKNTPTPMPMAADVPGVEWNV
jgi:hypothetical protein